MSDEDSLDGSGTASPDEPPNTPTTGLLSELQTVSEDNDTLRAELDALRVERDEVKRTVVELTHERDALKTKNSEMWEELQTLTTAKEASEAAHDAARSTHFEASALLQSESVVAQQEHAAHADGLQRELEAVRAQHEAALRAKEVADAGAETIAAVVTPVSASASASADDARAIFDVVAQLRVDIATLGAQLPRAWEATALRLSADADAALEQLRGLVASARVPSTVAPVPAPAPQPRASPTAERHGVAAIALDRRAVQRRAQRPAPTASASSPSQREVELAERNARLQRKLAGARAALAAHEQEGQTCAVQLAKLLDMQEAATLRRRRRDEARVEQRFARSRVQLSDLARVHATQLERMERRCTEVIFI